VYASQKKGVKVNDFYVTRRGFYMDYDLKVAKGIPSSCIFDNIKAYISIKILGMGLKLFYKAMPLRQQDRHLKELFTIRCKENNLCILYRESAHTNLKNH